MDSRPTTEACPFIRSFANTVTAPLTSDTTLSVLILFDLHRYFFVVAYYSIEFYDYYLFIQIRIIEVFHSVPVYILID